MEDDQDYCIWVKVWDWHDDLHESGVEGKAYWETECGTTSVGHGNDCILTDDFQYCNKCGKIINENTEDYDNDIMESYEDPNDGVGSPLSASYNK